MKGFIGLDAHPAGCARQVASMVADLSSGPRDLGGPGGPVVVIGSSGGYGLPAAAAAAFRYRRPVLGVCLERPSRKDRTASAGWYNLVELHRQAAEAGIQLETVNADCFADDTKDNVIARLTEWGPPAALIYSVAAPVRTDPDTRTTYRSTLKPVESAFTTKTIKIDSGEVVDTTLEPATADEIDSTIKVMGGTDWARWINALDKAGLIQPGFKTVAFDYVGPKVTYPIYRSGTIGKAKADLEATARALDERLATTGASAWVSVNAAAVTQSSVAIPAVPLYLSLLLAVTVPTGQCETPTDQIRRLFDDHLAPPQGPTLDDQNRIRLDDWELAPEVQTEVARRWAAATTDTLNQHGDYTGFRRRFRQLFGFDVDGIDYTQPVDIHLAL